MGQTAGEIRGVIDTATAVVASKLWIRANREGAIELTCRLMGRDDPCRSFALLDPLTMDCDFDFQAGQ